MYYCIMNIKKMFDFSYYDIGKHRGFSVYRLFDQFTQKHMSGKLQQ